MRSVLFIAIFLSSASMAQAQYFSAGFQANAGFPIGDLRQKTGSIIFPEYSFSTYYKFPMKPIEVGFGLGYGKYGTELEKRSDLYPGFTDRLRLRRNNNLLTFMGIFRYNFESEKRLTPFLEAQAGANYFYTRYKIRETQFEEPIEQGMDFGDWVLGYRFGGGVKIPFKNRDMGHFEFKVLYHDSAQVEFLRKQDTEYLPDQGEGEFVYSIQRSPITMIQPGIGIIFTIGN